MKALPFDNAIDRAVKIAPLPLTDNFSRLQVTIIAQRPFLAEQMRSDPFILCKRPLLAVCLFL
jgi:hypothetical protein